MIARTIAVLVVTILAGCAAGPAPTGPGGRAEPRTLVIRNLSGRNVRTATIEAVVAGESAPRRFGTIAPIPRRAAPSVSRGDDAPRLAEELRVSWIDENGRRYERDVSIATVLLEATGAPGEALVFELRPQGGVEVRLEYVE